YVGKYLAKPGAIARQNEAMLQAICNESMMLLLQKRSYLFNGFPQNIGKIQRFIPEIDAILIDAGNFKKIVDKPDDVDQTLLPDLNQFRTQIRVDAVFFKKCEGVA